MWTRRCVLYCIYHHLCIYFIFIFPLKIFSTFYCDFFLFSFVVARQLRAVRIVFFSVCLFYEINVYISILFLCCCYCPYHWCSLSCRLNPLKTYRVKVTKMILIFFHIFICITAFCCNQLFYYSYFFFIFFLYFSHKLWPNLMATHKTNPSLKSNIIAPKITHGMHHDQFYLTPTS